MIATNGRLPSPEFAGTASARWPRTAVIAISAAMRTSRPRALRTSTRMPSPPIAYSATHFEARASPRKTPMTGIATQNAPRQRHAPVQIAANSV